MRSPTLAPFIGFRATLPTKSAAPPLILVFRAQRRLFKSRVDPAFPQAAIERLWGRGLDGRPHGIPPNRPAVPSRARKI